MDQGEIEVEGMADASVTTVMKAPIDPFAVNMRKLINNEDMSDIQFQVGSKSETIYAHKVILSANCEVLKELANADSVVVLPEVLPETFLAVLEFIYTNCVTLSGKNAIDVLGRSIDYGLDELRKLCIAYLIDNLCIQNACAAMQAAVMYKQDELRHKALSFIEEDTQPVFETEGFHNLKDTTLMAILQSDNLTVDEVKIVEAVKEWAEVNKVLLGKDIAEVASRVVDYIRLPLLGGDELDAIDEECDQPEKDRLISINHFRIAWKILSTKKNTKDKSLTTLRKGTKSREHHQSFT